MSAESSGPVPPSPSPLAPARPSASLPPPTIPTLPGQTSPVPPPPSAPALPTSGAPTLPVSDVPVLPPAMTPAPAPASSVAVASEPSALPASPPTDTNWKPIQRSKARKALNGLVGVGVLAAFAGGAWFGYQSLAPAEDTTTPTTLLVDNPDTFVGQASAVVEQINEQAPDQELLDLAGVESPDAPPVPALSTPPSSPPPPSTPPTPTTTP